MKIKSQGIALVQVLLITAIISVFALYITQTARQQVKMASWAQDRALAEVYLHSAQSELLFTLMTQEKYPTDQTDNSIIKKWNFYNQEFQLNDHVSIRMQDQSGLLNLHFIHNGRFIKLLVNNGVSQQRAVEILEHLLDWQDIDNIPRLHGREGNVDGNQPRNGAIADITELKHIISLSDKEYELLAGNTGIFFFGDFNPTTAPIPLISALSTPEAAQKVSQLRRDNLLTQSNFIETTKIVKKDDMNFYPSNVIGVTYRVEVNDVVVTKHQVISLARYVQKALSPLNVLLNRS